MTLDGGIITGTILVLFLTRDLEGVNVNEAREWAERLVVERSDVLLAVRALRIRVERVSLITNR